MSTCNITLHTNLALQLLYTVHSKCYFHCGFGPMQQQPRTFPVHFPAHGLYFKTLKDQLSNFFYWTFFTAFYLKKETFSNNLLMLHKTKERSEKYQANMWLILFLRLEKKILLVWTSNHRVMWTKQTRRKPNGNRRQTSRTKHNKEDVKVI